MQAGQAVTRAPGRLGATIDRVLRYAADVQRLVIRGCAIIVVLLGLAVMSGWVVEARWLVQVVPGFTPMQFNTALCFVLAGAGLLCVGLKKNFLVSALGVLTVLISGLTLVQYLTGWSFGIDELFMEHFVDEETAFPGRMAPNTAFAFMLSGTFLLLTVSPWHTALSNSLLLVVGPAVLGLGVLSLIGYAAGIEALFGWSQLTRMAIHTSAGFSLLGVGMTLKAWRLETERGRIRSYSLIAPAVVGSLTVMLGLWLALSQYEAQRLVALAEIDPQLAVRSTLPEIVLAVGLLLTALIGVSVHFAHASRETERLRAANAELLAANRELDQFAHIASHDLKAPLRGMRQLAVWLRAELGGDLSERSARYLSQIDSRAGRLQDLLDALLAYSRVGRHGRAPTRFDPGSAIAATVALADLPAGMEVRIDADGAPMTADLALFEMVLLNLLSNAVRHHDRCTGVIQITARQERDGYRLEVADDGPGIAPRHHARVFEIFQTLRPRDEFEASGMGLAIVRKAVDRSGGTVTLYSDPERERGARFVVYWPGESKA